MDFRLSPEQDRFRAELRSWLEANCPGDWGRIRSRLATREAQAEFLIEWQRKLHAAGYVGLHWPPAYGGRGATVLEQAIFYEEMARARAPELPNDRP
jgi:alkylation response protein AidB-like acyl-CoA dehydrogenase